MIIGKITLSSTQRGVEGPEVKLKGIELMVDQGSSTGSQCLVLTYRIETSFHPPLHSHPPHTGTSPFHSLSGLVTLQVTSKCPLYHPCLLTHEIIKDNWVGNHI